MLQVSQCSCVQTYAIKCGSGIISGPLLLQCKMGGVCTTHHTRDTARRCSSVTLGEIATKEQCVQLCVTIFLCSLSSDDSEVRTIEVPGERPPANRQSSVRNESRLVQAETLTGRVMRQRYFWHDSWDIPIGTGADADIQVET